MDMDPMKKEKTLTNQTEPVPKFSCPGRLGSERSGE